MVNDRGVMGGASNNDSLTSYCDAVFVYLSLCISSVYFAIVPTKYKCNYNDFLKMFNDRGVMGGASNND